MKTLRPAVRIGVVVHGPEVIDSGAAVTTLDRLSAFGEVRAVLGGTMGKVAVIDWGLEDRIDISKRMVPSRSLIDLQVDSDILILLNQAKNRETALVFGSMIAARASLYRPLIQVDWGGRLIACLVGEETQLAQSLATDLGLDLLASPTFSGQTVDVGGRHTRKVVGVVPGECLTLDGIVIGRVTGDEVEVAVAGGRIIELKGALPKVHGMEKLSDVDLRLAILRSGNIRRTNAPSRRLDPGRVGEPEGHIVIIDHAAEGAFESAKGASVVVTVGDDTTYITGEILGRLGIPLIGIVDGDRDCLCSQTCMPPGSTIVRVRQGMDDQIGKKIREHLAAGGSRSICQTRAVVRSEVIRLAGEDLLWAKDV